MKSIAFVAALGAASPAVADTYGKYETPRYTVVMQEGAFELRAYEPALMAEVTVRASQSAALRKGFQILAGYIFGGNTSAESVAMTSPVAQTASQTIAMTSPVAQTGQDGMWTVAFMMPRDYTMDTLPIPNNEAIRFVMTQPVQKVAVSFSGFASPGQMATKETALRGFAQTQGLDVTGAAEYLHYDDPFTLPWKRRNEVTLAVR